MPSAAILHIDISAGATKTSRFSAAHTLQPGSTQDRGRRVEDIATRASKAPGKGLVAPLASGEAESAKAQRSPPSPPKPEDFLSRQMDLSRQFLCNTDVERDEFSHTIDLWDSIPKSGVSRQQQDRLRQVGHLPLLIDVPFHHRGRMFRATIQPAAVRGKDGVVRSYFPSASEELLEEAMRKLASDQDSGYCAPREQRSGGVVFTLHALRKELERRGHGRSYAEIVLSLDILSSSVIEIATADAGDSHFVSKSGYLHNLVRGCSGTISPDAQWYSDFHPLLGVIDKRINQAE